MSEENINKEIAFDIEISDEDIYDAMKDIQGYIDITPGDVKELYKFAYRHAYNRIVSSVRAQDIMTRNVITVAADTPLKIVAKIMAEEGISGVPVIDGEKRVLGVISEKDFLSRMGAKDTASFMGVVAECLKGKGCVAISVRAGKATDLMTSPAITVDREALVVDVADIFTSKKINRVPVVDHEGLLIGIVSRADIVRASLPRGSRR